MPGSKHHWGAILGLAASLSASACFGEWVSARSRTKRDGPPAPAAGSEGEAPPAQPCSAYLGAVARHCGEILEGRPHDHGCHPEIVRVMTLYRSGDQPLDHRQQTPAPEDRDRTCASYLRAMPERRDEPPPRAELGPQCAAWGERLRERCVDPLGTIPPKLDGCSSDLLAFEGTLRSIAFGRGQDYEPLCGDAVERLDDAP